VALTLAATNAYISGATELAGRLRGAGRPGRKVRRVPLAIAGLGLVELALVGCGLISMDALVAVPTAMFVTVYAIATAAAVRLTVGATRVAAGLACLVVLVILAFSGWALLGVATVAGVATLRSSHGSAVAPARPEPCPCR
jgi:amino acid efflux transporter